MFGDDRTQMQSYPEETPILFKIEKITGALDFLNSLTAIAKEVKAVQPHIDRLLEINMALYPEVEKAISKINAKFDEKVAIKTNLETQINAISDRLLPFEDEIAHLRAAATQENPFSMNTYEISHPVYGKLKEEKSDLQSKLYKVNRLISDFNSFLGILNRSISRLDELKQSKQAA